MATKGAAVLNRTYFGQLTTEERSKTSQLVKFCEKVPAVKKSNDTSADEDYNMQRDDFVATLSLLWRHPGYSQKTRTWLQKKIESDRTRSTTPTIQDTKFEKLGNLKGVDDYWGSMWLQKHTVLTHNTLSRVVGTDPEAITQLLRAALNSDASLQLPPTLLLKESCELVFDVVYFKAGLRIQSFNDVDLIHKSTGLIRWHALGPYIIHFQNTKAPNEASEVEHRASGDKALVKHPTVISTVHKLCDNVTDMSAYVSFEGTTLFLHELFKRDKTGPYKYAQYSGSSKDFKKLAQDVLSEGWEHHKKSTFSITTPTKASSASGKSDCKSSPAVKLNAAVLAQKRSTALDSGRSKMKAQKLALEATRSVSFESLLGKKG
jgi:hypothetical protein